MTTPSRLWQPVVRLASRVGVRPYQGHENFLWPAQARAVLEASDVRIERLVGFNLLPLFRPVFDGVLRALDRAGAALPWVYVNFGLRGMKG